jgi:hypothetical protein
VEWVRPPILQAALTGGLTVRLFARLRVDASISSANSGLCGNTNVPLGGWACLAREGNFLLPAH